jgi:D-alanyl-lipoteichoic acid acyltransferase DltB (MBOAT superfamily)
MAIGSAYMLNIKLPYNFNSPYKAVNVQDFWRRWHMTLSRWLKDYVYIPLGGNRHGNIRTYVNIFITFVLGGIWHGAGWTFLAWGALHGAWAVVHRWWQQLGLRMPRLIAWPLTFLTLNALWVFFRATTFSDALKVLKGMAGLNGIVLPKFLIHKVPFLTDLGFEFAPAFAGFPVGIRSSLIILIIFSVVAFLGKNSIELKRHLKPNMVFLMLISFMFLYALLAMNKPSEFLYFQF